MIVSGNLLPKHLLKSSKLQMKNSERKIALETWLNIHIPLPWSQFQQKIHYLNGIKEALYEISGIHVFFINMKESPHCISKISDFQIYFNTSGLTSLNIMFLYCHLPIMLKNFWDNWSTKDGSWFKSYH